MIAENPYDVAILGGGLAGLTLARQLLLKNPATRVCVIEKRSFPVPETAHKVGESTVEIGAHYFGEQLKLKKHLTDQQLPKFGLRFFFKEPHQTVEEGTEVGASDFFSTPSYQVDRGRLENYLAETCAEMGADLLSDARIRGVDIDSQSHHRITFETARQSRSVAARWIVDASGRASFLKRKLKLEEDLGHDINAVWFRIDETIQIDNWCKDPDWHSLTGRVPRRWLSTNHLMGEGYWVWLIPLPTGSTSIGIVADPRIHPLNTINSFEKSIRWLEMHEPQCAESLKPHLDKKQDFLAIKKLSRGTRQVFSADRWGLVGEAAAFLDPFYSPGSDFIAIGNTMVAHLIEEDLAGRPIDRLAPTLQSVFLTLFQNNLITYRDQYPLFGNPRIMAVKFVWDYAVYWSFPSLLFFNEKITDVRFLQSNSKAIEEIRDMNVKMQQFFRDWYEADPYIDASATFVNQNQVELMRRLNAELRERLDDAALSNRFRQNVDAVRELMNEIIERVPQGSPNGETESRHTPVKNKQLCSLFESLEL